jgi:hypothetical protein
MYKVKTNHLGTLALLKVAPYRISDLAAQGVQVICLSKDRNAQSPGCVATLGRIFNEKDQFFHEKCS